MVWNTLCAAAGMSSRVRRNNQWPGEGWCLCLCVRGRVEWQTLLLTSRNLASKKNQPSWSCAPIYKGWHDHVILDTAVAFTYVEILERMFHIGEHWTDGTTKPKEEWKQCERKESALIIKTLVLVDIKFGNRDVISTYIENTENGITGRRESILLRGRVSTKHIQNWRYVNSSHSMSGQVDPRFCTLFKAKMKWFGQCDCRSRWIARKVHVRALIGNSFSLVFHHVAEGWQLKKNNKKIRPNFLRR